MKPICPQEDTDETIVERTRLDASAFGCLIDRYHPRLLRYIKRLLPLNAQDQDDILQDVFLNIFRHLNNFDPDLKFSAWAYQIAHNQAISHMRKHKKKWQIILSDQDSTILDAICEEDKSPYHIIAQNNDIKLLNEIINSLEQDYREVLLLRYAEHKDYNEISDILQKPRGSIASLISRGRERLIKLATQKGLIVSHKTARP